MAPKTLIIGYGSLLRGDDGAGRMAVRRLCSDPEICALCDLEECHQLLPEHAELVGGYDLVVFVDASACDTPGAVIIEELVIQGAEPASAGFPPHSPAPQNVLIEALRLYGTAPQACLCRIGGAEFIVSDRLSPPVLQAVEEAAAKIKVTIAKKQNIHSGK